VPGAVQVLALRPEAHADTCDAIVASLPYHFGNAEGRRECARAVRGEPGLVAVDGADVLGFLTFARRFDDVAEIRWMAVRNDRRGHGIGTALVERFAEEMAAEHRTLLTVLTVSPTDEGDEPDAPPGGGYAATRAFYRARGFTLVRDLPGLWPGDLAVLMARAMPDARTAAAAAPGTST
jgi:GNAT superfamily N-acetyltransferase